MAPRAGGVVSAVLSGVGLWLASTVGNGLTAYGHRQARQRLLKKAPRTDILLALLAVRLSSVAYLGTQKEVKESLSSPDIDVPGGLELVYFQYQRPEDRDLHPQWFIARGELPLWHTQPTANNHASGGRALYLVFRGTWSKLDLIRDLCVEPDTYKGRKLHGGNAASQTAVCTERAAGHA